LPVVARSIEYGRGRKGSRGVCGRAGRGRAAFSGWLRRIVIAVCAQLAARAPHDQIVSHLGGDPTKHVAMGAGYGLERFATLRYGIDDIRKIDVARVA
jgi:hypothetical protein